MEVNLLFIIINHTMKTIAKLAIVATLALVSARPKKRNPLLSVFKIKQQYGIWMMRIQFSKEGIHDSMVKHFEALDLDALSETDYKEKLLTYIEGAVDIYADDLFVKLSAADMLVDDEKVDIMYTLSGMPTAVNQLCVKIKTCSELGKNSNVLRFIHGKTTHHHILSIDNDYSTSFQV